MEIAEGKQLWKSEGISQRYRSYRVIHYNVSDILQKIRID